MLKLPVYNKDGKETDSIELPDDIFGNAVNQDVLHQAVTMYRASLRSGHASTKERGSVSGGGRKPWRQKGTGRARAGSSRSPLWNKGGVVFGPHPRNFGYTLPKKIKSAALRESLNAKFADKNLTCVDELKEKVVKTKEFAKILAKLKLDGKVLALLDGCDQSVLLASRNIRAFNSKRSADVNAYDVLLNTKLLVTKAAFKNLLKRIQTKS